VVWGIRPLRSRSTEIPPASAIRATGMVFGTQSPRSYATSPFREIPACRAKATWERPSRRRLNAQIHELDDAITMAALAHPDAPRLITHPGVGALTALATIVVLGPVARFSDSKHVVSYVGVAPALNASADTYHLGHIPKQGSTLLRFALGQAASHAAR